MRSSNPRALGVQEKTPQYSENPQLVGWAVCCSWDVEKLVAGGGLAFWWLEQPELEMAVVEVPAWPPAWPPQSCVPEMGVTPETLSSNPGLPLCVSLQGSG